MFGFIKYSPFFIRLFHTDDIECRYCKKLTPKNTILNHIYRECDFSRHECRTCKKHVFKIFLKQHEKCCKLCINKSE